MKLSMNNNVNSDMQKNVKIADDLQNNVKIVEGFGI